MGKSSGLSAIMKFGVAIATLGLTDSMAPAHGETQVQKFEASWTVTPWKYSGVVAARQWQYLPYKVWDSALGTLDRVEISTIVSGSRSNASDVQKFRYAFFTGWNPADYQFYEEVAMPGGDSFVAWQKTRSFTGSALGDWLTYSYLPQATYYFESTTALAAHSIFAETTLSYEYTPFSGPFTIDVATGTTTQIQAGRSLLSGTQSVAKTGVGTLVLDQINTTTGSATVRGGVLRLAHASSLSSSTISVLAGGTLTLASNLSTTVGGLRANAGGLIDVGTGAITVKKGLSLLSLFSAIQAGRADGTWTGSSGITSAAAASFKGSRTVGWLDNGDGSIMFGYAAPGDMNLDWNVDILDVAGFLSGGKFNAGLSATWAEGDSNYDGYADVLDLADFISSGLFNTGSYNVPAASIAVVPEPSILGPVMLLGLEAGLVRFMASRRHHSRRNCRSGGWVAVTFSSSIRA